MAHLVHAIGHMKINTSVVDAVVREATEILGLRVTRSGGGQTWLSSNGRAVELVVVHSDENSAHTIGLEALTVDAVRAAEAKVAEAGCTVVSRTPSLDCMAAGFTFVTPEGLRFEIHTPIRDDIAGRRHATYGVSANRMDHINLLTPDPAATRRQLEIIGGMRLSERLVNDSLSWMYGGNRQHHILGLVKGKGRACTTSRSSSSMPASSSASATRSTASTSRCSGAPVATGPATTSIPITSTRPAR